MNNVIYSFDSLRFLLLIKIHNLHAAALTQCWNKGNYFLSAIFYRIFVNDDRLTYKPFTPLLVQINYTTSLFYITVPQNPDDCQRVI